MPDLQTEELDVNVPISRVDDADPAMSLASSPFEDYLFRVRADLQSLNTEIETQIARIDTILGGTAVTGERDDPESALANLLTVLDTLGIIDDQTTAT